MNENKSNAGFGGGKGSSGRMTEEEVKNQSIRVDPVRVTPLSGTDSLNS